MNSFIEVVNATEQRFSERTSDRVTIHEKLETGHVLQADKPERVEKRLLRLGVEAATAKVLAGSDLTVLPPQAVVDQPDAIAVALERVIRKNDLMSVNFLEKGTHAARSIGRIRIRQRNGSLLGFGTGFLVSPRLLMTNNHVLANAEIAAFSQIEFNVQDDRQDNPLQPVVFNLEPNEFFVTDAYLDYTLVAVRLPARNGLTLDPFGWHPLIGQEGKVIIGESVSIIQHPNGEPKQLALRENELIDVLPDFLHYQTDTAPGSSGSPVFNDQWEVVALHHSGVPQRNDRGQIVNIDGEPWTPEQGEQRIAWIANEGVRISRIVNHLQQQPLPPTAAQLRSEMLNGQDPVGSSQLPATFTGATAETTRESTGETTVDATLPPTLPPAIAQADGTLTWNIPLQVSVRLGQPVPAVPPAETPAPSVPSPPQMPEPPSDQDLEDALQDLRNSAQKPYYDAAIDHQKRDAYYSDLLTQVDALGPDAFYQELKNLLVRTHQVQLSYQPSKHLYPWIDLHPDRKLRSIYSEQTFEAEEFIRADFQVEKLRAIRMQELKLKESLSVERLAQELDLLETSLPYNCEHVVPQSWFGKAQPMRGDLHHLFACEVRCNSFRGNTPYFDFPDFDEAIRDNCGKTTGNRFEPAGGKGAVARATLYFLLRYPGEINKTEQEYQSSRLQTLLDWHKTYPVTEYERHRNAAIQEKQGNRNPLIDFPEWVDKVAFQLGLG